MVLFFAPIGSAMQQMGITLHLLSALAHGVMALQPFHTPL
jgi:hypothetical protein